MNFIKKEKSYWDFSKCGEIVLLIIYESKCKNDWQNGVIRGKSDTQNIL